MPRRRYGKWRTVKWIGGGGNGDVYLCRDPGGIQAVIKVLNGIKQDTATGSFDFVMKSDS